MKRPKKIPTLFALLILISLIGLLSWRRFFFRDQSNQVGDTAALEITITNITDRQFTVFWISKTASLASLQYGTDKNKLINEAVDERDELANRQSQRRTHYITVSNLQPETNYYFALKIDKKIALQNNQLYEVTTGPILTPPLQTAPPLYGQIIGKDNQPLKEGVVLIKFSSAQLVSALIKPSGNFLLTQDSLRNQARNAFVELAAGKEGEMTIFDGQSITSGFFQIGQHSPLPTIVFGKNFDLRASALVPSPTNQPFLTNETRKALRSGFANLIGQRAVGVAPGTPAIIFPSPQAVFSETKPIFKGTGQSNKVVTLTINSSQSIVATVYTDDNGFWQFQPPEDLEYGPHTFTVVLTDAAGQLQTLTRSFTVLATEPSVIPPTSTPTAAPSPTVTIIVTPAAGMSAPTNTPTPAPTIKPTLTPTPTAAVIIPTSTPKPTPPVSGFLDNSLLLIISGGLLSLFGLGSLFLIFNF